MQVRKGSLWWVELQANRTTLWIALIADRMVNEEDVAKALPEKKNRSIYKAEWRGNVTILIP